MKVLSLFDSISCGRVALEEAGIPVDVYYASEVDNYAMAVSRHNYPDTVYLGDVKEWKSWDIDWASIDLVMGGFPCQAWSLAGNQQGDRDPRGELFWDMLDIIKRVLAGNPKAKFLMENVKMKKEFEQYITYHTEQALEIVYKHLINSDKFSAQTRKRYYWTNIEGIVVPEKPSPILLKDILEDGFVDRDKSLNLDATYWKGESGEYLQRRYFGRSIRQIVMTLDNEDLSDNQKQDIIEEYSKRMTIKERLRKKSKLENPYLDKKDIDRALQAHSSQIYSTGNKRGNMKFPHGQDRKSKSINSMVIKGSREAHHIEDKIGVRILTPLEFERLQTLPEGYTLLGDFGQGNIKEISSTQRYKMIGNGWTIKVITHILSFM